MPTRLLRSAAALVVAASASTAYSVSSAAPALAAGYNGYCKTSSGVTVVVDFRALGGGVAIRCSPVGKGATGVQALQRAGIPVQGTRQYGLATPCRIYGKPSASATLPGGYHESCVRMPPAKAYWSYWKASNGGSWVYSNTGAATSTVRTGGFEGWAFSTGSKAAPRATPRRSAVKPPASHPTASSSRAATPPAHRTKKTKKPTTHAKAGGSAKPTPHAHHAATSPVPRPTAGKAAGGGTGAAHRPSSHGAVKTGSGHAASSSSAHRSRSSSSATGARSSTSSAAAGGPSGKANGTDAAAGAPVADSDRLIDNSKKSGGVNPTTIVGGAVLLVLVAGGGAVAFARRRRAG